MQHVFMSARHAPVSQYHHLRFCTSHSRISAFFAESFGDYGRENNRRSGRAKAPWPESGGKMKNSKIAMLLLGASTLALSLPVWAQSADSGTEAVTVTGSRVVRQGFEAPTPTTAIGSVELEQKAAVTVTVPRISALAPSTCAVSVLPAPWC
jgi:hypothetical protein